MKPNFWTVTTAIFLLTSIACLWLADSCNDVSCEALDTAAQWKSRAEEARQQTDRSLAVAGDLQRVAEGWRALARSHPVDAVDRSGLRPAEEEIKEDSPFIQAAMNAANPNAIGMVQEDDSGFVLLAEYRPPASEYSGKNPDINLWVECTDGRVEFVHQDPNDRKSPLVMTDESIHRLCESGRVCAVLGHQWDVVFITLPISINGGPVGPGEHEEKCCVCGRIRDRKYVEGHWTDWQEKGD